MIKFIIETIPHESQRYDTVGDWYTDGNGIHHILVSDMENWKMELAVAVHEIIEQALCLDREISEESVSGFDKAHLSSPEPGNELDAPYHKEHVFATHLEKQLCDELNLNWDEYENKVQSL